MPNPPVATLRLSATNFTRPPPSHRYLPDVKHCLPLFQPFDSGPQPSNVFRTYANEPLMAAPYATADAPYLLMHPVRYVDLTGCLYRNEAPTYTQKYVLSNIVTTQYHQIVALEQELQVYRATISSPIRRLPIELLAQIMVLIITGDKGDLDPCDVLALAHVSRLWRYTAFREADLWTRLELSWEQACHPRAIEQTIAWFYRARDRPVCLSVDDYCDCALLAPSDCPLLAFVLLRLGPQILELNLRCPIEWLDSLASCTDGSFPILRKFQLDVQNNEWLGFDLRAECPTKFPINTFHRLKVFHIRGFDSIMCEANAQLVSLFSLPWAQLQSLQLDDVEEIHEWGEIVLRCTSLVCAKIRSKGPASAQWPLSGGVPPTEEVTFPHLRHLELFYEGLPSVFLNVARCPALTTLILGYLEADELSEVMVEDDETTWSVLYRLVGNLQTLTSLSILGFSFKRAGSEDKVMYILRNLPLLAYIAFDDCNFRSLDALLSFFRPPGNVPLLEELHFSDVDLEDNWQDSGDGVHRFVHTSLQVAFLEETYAAIEVFLRDRGLAESSCLRYFKVTLLEFEKDNVEDEFRNLNLRRLERLQELCFVKKGLEICLDAIPSDELDDWGEGHDHIMIMV